MPCGAHRVNVFQRGMPAVLVGDEPPDRVRAAPWRAGVEIDPVGRVVVELPREVRAVDGEEPFLAGRDVMTSDADVPLFGKLPFVLVVENEPVCCGDVAACVRAAQRCDRAVRTEAEHIVCQLSASHTLDQSVLAAAEHEEALIEQRPLGCHVLAVAEKLVEGEREKILALGDTLHKRVIGQDEAVDRVTEAIMRSRAGINDPKKPLGSFLFLGPTGVGKTELAKALAEALFDDEHSIVRLDMSEYMEKYSVSRLIGAPPGYVGYEEGGQLTEAVRRKPYSVVLFDEVEKAHPDVFNVLLQVLDDGRITDGQGRTVDFRNTIIILTSNLGSQYILDGINEQGEISEEARKSVDMLLKQSFRPEFLNRLDEIVFYKPLRKEEIFKIIDLLAASLKARLKDKQLDLDITDAAKQAIVDASYDPSFGARPLKRYIQRNVETIVAKEILRGEVHQGDIIVIDAVGGELTPMVQHAE